MEQYQVTYTDGRFHVEGLPDAVKVIELRGGKARQVAHMALHKNDLQLVLMYLDEINKVESHPIKEALWHYAIVRFIQCFVGGSARIRLDENEIYKNEPEGKKAFEYFKSLRNNHVVHDENAYTQCLPGAAINAGDKAFKIEKILTLYVGAQTLEQGNFGNLHLLASRALSWVEKKYDQLCDLLTKDLEREPYAELIARKAVEVKVPDVAEIGVRRRTP